MTKTRHPMVSRIGLCLLSALSPASCITRCTSCWKQRPDWDLAPPTSPQPQDAVRLERNSRGWVIGDQAWRVVGNRSHGGHGHSVLVPTARAVDRPPPCHDVTFRLSTIPRISVELYTNGFPIEPAKIDVHPDVV